MLLPLSHTFMTHLRTAVVVGCLLGGAGALPAQQRAVTLAEAIRRSARVQPDVIRAQGNVRAAGARTRSAWGSFLPTLSASSSASEFFSEGASRIDPVTGLITSGNTSNRSLSTSLSASIDLFTGFRRGAELSAARAGESAAGASLVDARFQQALMTTSQFLDALAGAQLLRVRETSVRRAEEQLKVSIAKLKAGSATRSRAWPATSPSRVWAVSAGPRCSSAAANRPRLISTMPSRRCAWPRR
jgi:outer membrane protein